MQIAVDGLLRGLAKENEPLLVSFPNDAGAPAGEVELFNTKGQNFGRAETGEEAVDAISFRKGAQWFA